MVMIWDAKAISTPWGRVSIPSSLSYSVAELADILGKTQSAIKMRLSKGRKLLREAYGKEQNHG